ncbi:hypothetical protein SKAU_G00057280 [Synaphobranchus kaupii]|uniref:Uncharacterized protein n=1 Tax=Synaphobranchus kaupii TaxID=118154 RepID=A0A9Q1G524_SYNKA|nr:hypothetical protein SKAU_G00057280 [Synaphobranchus kaupii]
MCVHPSAPHDICTEIILKVSLVGKTAGTHGGSLSEDDSPQGASASPIIPLFLSELHSRGLSHRCPVLASGGEQEEWRLTASPGLRLRLVYGLLPVDGGYCTSAALTAQGSASISGAWVLLSWEMTIHLVEPVEKEKGAAGIHLSVNMCSESHRPQKHSKIKLPSQI